MDHERFILAHVELPAIAYVGSCNPLWECESSRANDSHVRL